MSTAEKYTNIPAELRERPQWVAWTFVKRDGKDTKLPVDPTTHRLARTNDPETWSTFDRACQVGKSLSGIGYVFSSDDPYCGIDIDSTPDAGLLEWFDSYTERSWSGRGAHIIVRAKVDQGRHKEHGIFSERRYFVFTGDVLLGRPIRDAQREVDEWLAYNFPEHRQQEIPEIEVDITGFIDGVKERTTIFNRIRQSPQWEKFERLWSGDRSDYSSQSEADAALLSILRFWNGGKKLDAIDMFSQCAFGRRDKWRRHDYQERTWKLIDDGDVYQEFSGPVSPPLIKERLAPWRCITTDQVADIVSTSALQPIIDYFAAPMCPPLPLEVTLLKAMVMAGCALSQRRDALSLVDKKANRGIDAARLRILTAGGQACNIYGLLAAPSGYGKDIGGGTDILAIHHGWLIANAGSTEGLADVLSGETIERGNGFLAISEFSNWLDKTHWQSKAASFLTDAFSRGWFAFALSSRTGTKQRESHYCYPSILANIQPEALAKYASQIDLSTGFLSRFIVSKAPEGYYGRPEFRDYSHLINPAIDAIRCYAAKEGDVIIDHEYLTDVWEMFSRHKASQRGHWSRLVNQYGARIAVMLSVAIGDDSPQITITPKAWHSTDVLIQWYYSMSEAVFGEIEEDQQTAKRERLYRRVLRFVIRHPSCTNREIQMGVSSGTTKRERWDAIQELKDRGQIIETSEGKFLATGEECGECEC